MFENIDFSLTAAGNVWFRPLKSIKTNILGEDILMLRGENLDFRALNLLGMLNSEVQIISFFCCCCFTLYQKSHRKIWPSFTRYLWSEQLSNFMFANICEVSFVICCVFIIFWYVFAARSHSCQPWSCRLFPVFNFRYHYETAGLLKTWSLYTTQVILKILTALS